MHCLHERGDNFFYESGCIIPLDVRSKGDFVFSQQKSIHSVFSLFRKYTALVIETAECEKE